MNDFDFHYMHYARSEELIKDAENERLARSLIKAAKETRRGGTHVRHDGVAQRVARAFGSQATASRRAAPSPAREMNTRTAS